MDDLKSGLSHLHAHLGELETAARKLPNQNFADIIKSARGRLAQASEHPDVEAVHNQLKADHGESEHDDGQKPLPFPGANAHGLGPDTAGGPNLEYKGEAFDPSAGNTDAQTYG